MNLARKKQLLRFLEIGARNSRVDYSRIQEIHDAACSLGAKCNHDNVLGVMEQYKESRDVMGQFCPHDDCDKFLVLEDVGWHRCENCEREIYVEDTDSDFEDFHVFRKKSAIKRKRGPVPQKLPIAKMHRKQEYHRILRGIRLAEYKGQSARGKSCVQKLMAKGMDESKAIAICRASLQENVPAKYSGINFKPPKAVQQAAMRGLALRQKFNRGGLGTNQAGKLGIGSGVARATQLAQGKNVSPQVIKQMVSFFARHEKNKNSTTDNGEPGAGKIAWAIWGGDAGQRWASKVRNQMDAADKKAESVLRALEADGVKRNYSFEFSSERLANEFEAFLSQMAYNSQAGHSAHFGLFVDGDGQDKVTVEGIKGKYDHNNAPTGDFEYPLDNGKSFKARMFR